MFVKQSTYDKLLTQFHTLGHAYTKLMHSKNALLREWNAMIEKINAKGGEEFLEHGVLRPRLPAQFTAQELRELVQLCHPDKHPGKESAHRLSIKLNALREAQS